MPIYAFECAACGHTFDELMKLSDPDPAHCPACSAPQVRRQLTAPQFRLSGAGWYETDFKKGDDKKRNLAGEKESKPVNDSSGTKSDAAATKSAEPAGKKDNGSTSTAAASPAPAAKPSTPPGGSQN